jgi:hypothetical protein
MEFIVEIIFECILEGMMQICYSQRIPKVIRYFFMVLIALFFASVIGMIAFLGIFLWNENILLGIFLIAIALFLLWGCVVKVIKSGLLKR